MTGFFRVAGVVKKNGDIHRISGAPEIR